MTYFYNRLDHLIHEDRERSPMCVEHERLEERGLLLPKYGETHGPDYGVEA